MSHKKSILSILFFALIFLANQHNTLACQCAEKPTVLDSFEYSKLVIIAKAVSVEKETQNEYAQNGLKSTKMVVEKVYKGDVKFGDELTFAQGGGADCIWTFSEKSIGRKYLLYLGSPSKGHPSSGGNEENSMPMYYVGGCGRSTGLDDAVDDFQYLNNLDKVRGKTRISGKLSRDWYSDSPSFANIKIKIIGKNKVFETTTDKNGFYEIYDLPPGLYLIEPQFIKGWKVDTSVLQYERRFSNKYYDAGPITKNRIPLILEEKKHAGLDLLYVHSNAIGGKVLSPAGKPIANVCVRAVSKNELKEGRFRGQYAYTNTRGEFKINEVSPGEFTLMVNDDFEVTVRNPAFGILFYPGVSNYKSAGLISVDTGQFRNGVIIKIPRLEPLVKISGMFQYSNGTPVTDQQINFISSNDEAYGKIKIRSDKVGRFEFKIPKRINGKLSGELYISMVKLESCPGLKDLTEKIGKISGDINTNEVEIQGNNILTDIKLTFPFYCLEPKR